MTEFKRRILAAFLIGGFVFLVTGALIYDRDRHIDTAHFHGQQISQQADEASGDDDASLRTIGWPLFERIDQGIFDNLFSIARPHWADSGASSSAAPKDVKESDGLTKPGSKIKLSRSIKSEDVIGIVVDSVTMQNFADEPSFGQWPWSRAAWEEILTFIGEGQPKAIIFDIIFAEPMRTEGVQEGVQEWPPGSGTFLRVADITFAYAITGAEKVYLPYRLPNRSGREVESKYVDFLDGVEPLFSSDSASITTDSVKKVYLTSATGSDLGSPAVSRGGRVCDAPFPALSERCYGFGWADGEIDPDGSLRRSALVVSHPLKKGSFFPTLSVAAVMNGNPELLSMNDKGQLFHSGKRIPSDTRGHHLIRWEGRQDSRFQCYAAGRVVLSYRHSLGEVDKRLPEDLLLKSEDFKDKYVVIGTTMAAGHDMKRTPFGGDEPGMVKHLTLLQNLLSGNFMDRSSSELVLAISFLFSFIAAFIFLFLGSAQRGMAILCLTVIVYAMVVSQLFIHLNYELDVTAPVFSLFLTFALSLSWNYFVEDRQKRAVRKMFDKYMSPELVAEMMNNPELVKPGGQNRYLTAFFSDLANFTSLSESLTPEELVVVINEYLDLMTREIIGNGGYLDKYQGDGIMAVFGVYGDEAHHALESCKAALANQRDILTLSRRWISEGRAEVHVRIGINSGPMIAGNVGSEAKMNYTVLGDAVNLAARLESANKQFGTLIMLGHNTYELVKSEVIARELDLLAVKGKKLGVRVYELIGMNDDYVLSTKESDMLSCFDEGLQLYREQKFEEAIISFKRGLKFVPDDGPCKSYIDRCGTFAKDPPGKDWDGVYRLTSK